MPRDDYVPRFWRKAVRREAEFRWEECDPFIQSDLVVLAKKIAKVPRPEYQYYYSGSEQHLLHAEISAVLDAVEAIARLEGEVRFTAETLYIDGTSLVEAIEAALVV
jgi:hypothetical protein